jgi:hypothetical protein
MSEPPPPASEDGLAPPVPGYGMPPDPGARLPHDTPPVFERRAPRALYAGIALAVVSTAVVAVVLVVFRS